MEPLNPGSDWKACTCDGPFADMPPNMEPESSVREQIVGIWRQNGRSEKVAELDELISEAGGAAAVLEQVQQKYAQRPNGTPTAHQRLTIFRSGCGEMTLMRPEEGISAASIDRDREDFVKQFRRAERLDRMAADGLASPAGKKMNLPSLAGPSNESQVLLDQMLLESDLAPMEGGSAVTNPRRRTFGNGAAAAQPGQMPEPEPEPESAPHGDALVRTLVHDHVVVRPGVLQDRTQSRYVHGVKHYMGHELWVGNIIDAELEGGKGVCEKALWSVFERYGKVDRVTLREKYEDEKSERPFGRQSWALVAFDLHAYGALDRAMAADVLLHDEVLLVRQANVKAALSSKDIRSDQSGVNLDGSVGEIWQKHNSIHDLKGHGSMTILCFKKTKGKWALDLRCGKAGGRKKPWNGATKEELGHAFNMFDMDGNGAIDKDELTFTMRQLAKSGRVKQPTDEQIETMLSQADEESDGEIDFDEFCDLIANCDLHPTTLTRCEQSQYLLSEDFYFGEPRPEDGDGQRPDTFRGRMAARDEAAIHMSFAMVASGAPLQTVLSTLGAVVWLGVNDQRDGTQNAMIVGAIHVVATSFAVTIGCASRPAAKWAFAVYLVWEVAGVVVVLMALGALGDATSSQCSLSPPGGAAAVSTEHACPQLIVGAGSIGDAKTQCVNDLTQVHCEWSDKCVFGTEASCAAITPLGTCDYVSGECQVADDTVPFRQHGALDLWGTCSQTAACSYQGFLSFVGWAFVCVAGSTALAIVYILDDSRNPLGLQLTSRTQPNMWTMAMQMSMDPSMHSAKAFGTVSERYGANVPTSLASNESALLGAAMMPSFGSDGKLVGKKSSLGI